MVWLHPAFLAFLALAALPFLIHWIGKSQNRVVEFSAFEFLMRAHLRISRWESIRRWLLLFFRMLLIALAALAVARPVPKSAMRLSKKTGPLVLILDASQSMNYRLLDGTRLWDAAKEHARQVISEHSGELVVAIAHAPTEQSVPLFYTDSSSALDAIRNIKEGHGNMTLDQLFNGVFERLGEQTDARWMLLSDFSNHSLQGRLPSHAAIKDVLLWDAAQRDTLYTLANQWIVDAGVRSHTAGPSMSVRVRVKNQSDQSVQRHISVILDDTVVQQVQFDLDAASEQEQVLNIRKPGAGEHVLKLALLPSAIDGAGWDDAYHIAFFVEPELHILLVNGRPNENLRRDPLFYVEKALSVATERGALPKVDVVDPEGFGLKDLSAYDVIIIGDAVMPLADVAELVGYVQNGGGLWFMFHPGRDPDLVNERYQNLLPRPLRSWHQLADSNAGLLAKGAKVSDLEHPMLRGWQSDVRSVLERTQTSGVFLLRRQTTKDAKTVLSLDNGAPLLMTKRIGRGKVALWTTSLDRSATDICLFPFFPALLQDGIRYLSPNSGSSQTYKVARLGEKLLMPGPIKNRNQKTQNIRHDAVDSTRWLLKREGPKDSVISVQTDGSDLWLEGATQSGIYRLDRVTDSNTRQERLVLSLNASLSESDFRPVAKERLSGQNHRVSNVTDKHPSTRKNSALLLAGMLLVLAFEGLLALRG